MSCGPKTDRKVCPQCGGNKPSCGCGGSDKKTSAKSEKKTK